MVSMARAAKQARKLFDDLKANVSAALSSCGVPADEVSEALNASRLNRGNEDVVLRPEENAKEVWNDAALIKALYNVRAKGTLLLVNEGSGKKQTNERIGKGRFPVIYINAAGVSSDLQEIRADIKSSLSEYHRGRATILRQMPRDALHRGRAIPADWIAPVRTRGSRNSSEVSAVSDDTFSDFLNLAEELRMSLDNLAEEGFDTIVSQLPKNVTDPRLIEHTLTYCLFWGDTDRARKLRTKLIELFCQGIGPLSEEDTKRLLEISQHLPQQDLDFWLDRFEISNRYIEIIPKTGAEREPPIRFAAKESVGILFQLYRAVRMGGPILLTGRSGSGKEAFAKFCHWVRCTMDKRPMAFRVFNTAAIPDGIAESELFGSVEGAYNGAKDKKGMFEIVEDGTLFLDEINSASLPLQAKLLLAVQEPSVFYRVGSQKPQSFKGLLVTAANQNLADRCRDREFREDLYSRIQTWAVEIPEPARRKKDLLVIANGYLQRKARVLGISCGKLSPAIEKDLRAGCINGRHIEDIRQLQRELMHVLSRHDEQLSIDLEYENGRVAAASRPPTDDIYSRYDKEYLARLAFSGSSASAKKDLQELRRDLIVGYLARNVTGPTTKISKDQIVEAFGRFRFDSAFTSKNETTLVKKTLGWTLKELRQEVSQRVVRKG